MTYLGAGVYISKDDIVPEDFVLTSDNGVDEPATIRLALPTVKAMMRHFNHELSGKKKLVLVSPFPEGK